MEHINDFKSYIASIWLYIKAHIKVGALAIIIICICYILYIFMGSPVLIMQSENTIKQTDQTNLESFLQACAYVSAVLSLIFLYGTMIQSRRIAEAEFIRRSIAKYFSSEMIIYMRRLVDYAQKHPKYFRMHRTEYVNPKDEFAFPYEKEMKWCSDTDEARRFVKGYFINALELYEQGKISRQSLRSIVDKSGLTVLFEIIEPLDVQMNPEYDASYYYRLMLFAGDLYKKRRKTSFPLKYNRKRIRTTYQIVEKIRKNASTGLTVIHALALGLAACLVWKKLNSK